MTLASYITAFRLVLGGLVLFAIIRASPYVAIAIGFGHLALDALDGAIARATGTVTKFGEFFDTVADSFFAGCALIGVLAIGRLSVLDFAILAVPFALDRITKFPSQKPHFEAAGDNRLWLRVPAYLPGLLILLALLNVPELRTWVRVVICLIWAHAIFRVWLITSYRAAAAGKNL